MWCIGAIRITLSSSFSHSNKFGKLLVLRAAQLTFYFSRKYYLFVFFDEFYFILLGFNFVHNECTLMHLCLTLTCINYYHKNYTQHFHLQIKMKCENQDVLISSVDSWLSSSWLYDFVVGFSCWLLLIGETERPIRRVTRPLIDIITTLALTRGLGKTNPGAVTTSHVLRHSLK